MKKITIIYNDIDQQYYRTAAAAIDAARWTDAYTRRETWLDIKTCDDESETLVCSVSVDEPSNLRLEEYDDAYSVDGARAHRIVDLLLAGYRHVFARWTRRFTRISARRSRRAARCGLRASTSTRTSASLARISRSTKGRIYHGKKSIITSSAVSTSISATAARLP